MVHGCDRTLEERSLVPDRTNDPLDDLVGDRLPARLGPWTPRVPSLHDVRDPHTHRGEQVLLDEVDTDAREHLALHGAPQWLRVDQHAVHVEHDGLDRACLVHHGNDATDAARIITDGP